MPSVEQLERLLRDDPNDAFLLYALAQELAKAGRADEAIAAYDRCLAADPNYCYAYFHKARVQAAAQRPGEALATLRFGLTAARRAGDLKAASEIQGYLDELE